MIKEKKLVFVTNNQNKLFEINSLLAGTYDIKSLKDIGFYEDIDENGTTLEANASEKAWFIYNKFQQNCFADDTGLEVTALNMAPGVYSARYAGNQKCSGDNIEKLLKELSAFSDKTARFRTVISLIIDGKEYQFEGIVNGEIQNERKGMDGFGYDPVFRPNGYSKTFAEMSLVEKNKISHRGNALRRLVDFLSV